MAILTTSKEETQDKACLKPETILNERTRSEWGGWIIAVKQLLG